MTWLNIGVGVRMLETNKEDQNGRKNLGDKIASPEEALVKRVCSENVVTENCSNTNANSNTKPPNNDDVRSSPNLTCDPPLQQANKAKGSVQQSKINQVLCQLVSFDTEKLINVVSMILKQLILKNDKMPPKHVTLFHSQTPPDISIRSYMLRFYQHAGCTNECFIVLLLYLDLIHSSDKNYYICSINAHRLIATALVLALKYTQDNFHTNRYYARVAGVPLSELNALEFEFFRKVNYSIGVKPETICGYFEQIILRCVQQKANVPNKRVKIRVE